MNITEVKIHEINKDKLKAYASITIDRDFVVTGISIVDGKNGLFVTMPQRKAGEEWKDICFPTSKETRKELSEAVLREYKGGDDEGFYPE